jgi:glycosyltransferase involved in cell wall biosynthesis
MNILVWSSYVGQPAGGQEKIALELARQFHQRGHRVVLAGPYDNAPELRARIPAEMPYYSFDLHRRRRKPQLAALRLLARVIREHAIEVCSAHGNVFALAEICRRQKIPVVWTIHGASAAPTGMVGWLKTTLVRRVVACDTVRLVAVSHATREILRQRFPRLAADRLLVIHNGIIDEAALAALPVPRPGPPWRLGFIGRLAERKQPLDLIEVARRLDYTIHVFGDGPLAAPLRAAIAAHGLADRFVLHGHWTRGSAGMVEQFHVLVHTDRVEPFGGALLEAQLGARPVAAYRVGGNPEIVEHGKTGWLVACQDYDGLIAGIRQITGTDFSRYAQASRQRAAAQFSMQRMVEQYANLMETLTSCRSSRVVLV